MRFSVSCVTKGVAYALARVWDVAYILWPGGSQETGAAIGLQPGGLAYSLITDAGVNGDGAQHQTAITNLPPAGLAHHLDDLIRGEEGGEGMR